MPIEPESESSGQQAISVLVDKWFAENTFHAGEFQHLEHLLALKQAAKLERILKSKKRQWVRAKSFDTFCPMGPWMVTADELGTPPLRAIATRVNGETRQASDTGRMIHDVCRLVSFLSQAFTLEPGDVVATGTPSGVGAFRQPPAFLQAGDVVEIEIEGIGVLRNPVRDAGDD